MASKAGGRNARHSERRDSERPHPFEESERAPWVTRGGFSPGDKFWYFRPTGLLYKYGPPVELSPDMVFQGVSFRGESPLKAYLDLTYRCNLRCRHCITNSSPDVDCVGELSTPRLLELVDELAALGVLEMALAGGEPLLHPDCIQIFERVIDSGMNLIVTTNGLLLRDKMLEALSAIDPLEVRISFDGGPTLHDYVRGTGTYIRSMRNMGRLAAAGVRVAARLTLCNGAEQELPHLVHDVAQQGVTMLKVALIKEAGRASTVGRELLRSKGQASTVDLLTQLAAAHGLQLSLATDDFPVEAVDGHLSKLRDVERANCGAGIETCYITPRGEVLMCAAMPEHGFGNITDQRFADVWLGGLARRYRQIGSAASGRLCEAGIPPATDVLVGLSPARRSSTSHATVRRLTDL